MDTSFQDTMSRSILVDDVLSQAYEIPIASTHDGGVCRLCLSSDRAMFPVGDVAWAFSVLTDAQQQGGGPTERVCWECSALLRRLHMFRRQAARAAEMLSAARASNVPTSLASLSRLRVSATKKLACDASTDLWCDASTELWCDASTELLCDASPNGSGDRRETKAVPFPFDMEISADVDLSLVKELEIIPKVEPDELEDCDVWADAPYPAAPRPPPEPAPSSRKRKKARDKREKIRVKEEVAEEELGELEGVCERAWERACDVQRKRDARLKSASFLARRFKCLPCAVSFKSEAARAAHERTLHCEAAGAAACEVCACRPADAAALQQHRATHRLLRCLGCRYATRSHRNMQRHAATHARAQPRQAISCDVCGKQFTNRQHFYVHHKTHTSRQTYECDHCGRVYRTRTQMFRHLRSHRKLFLCDICGKMFSDQTYLNCHYLAHSAPSARRFECPQCHKRYINKFKLIVHMRFHTGEKPYRCDACDKCYREKAQLTTHNRKYHREQADNDTLKKRSFERTKSAFVNERFVESKEMNMEDQTETKPKGNKERTEKTKPRSEPSNYVCNFCGKKFKDKWRLKFHLAVHSDERPYKCDECDLTFKYQSGLWTHKLLHKGDKPHQCTTCGSQFTQKGNLTAHLKIHTNEKPFQCSVCGNKFRMRRNLRNHFKIHSNMEARRTEAVL